MSDAETTHKTANIPEWKRREVDELVDFVESYDAVGVVDLTGIPSRQLQDMRRELHGQAALRMSRNTLTVRALEEVGGTVAELAEQMTGHVGLIGTNDNPFGLYQQLEASKTSAPIGAGEIAPNEIVIPEGDTGVDPGPFVGELQQIGADARIQEGSIQVLSDSVVAETGDEVSADMANVLGELGIEPKEVGLDLRAVVADGVLFDPEDLAIDVDEYRADVEAAAAAGRNLSINAAYPTAQTAGALLGKAANEAKGLGVFAAIEDEAIMPDLVAKADAQVRAIAAEIDDEDALPEALRDLDAPTAADTADDAGDDDEADADEADADEAQDDEDDTEDDGDEDGAAGLGNMFGD